jgi:hypothetical protein
MKQVKNMEVCECVRGGNKCGRRAEFYVENNKNDDVYASCSDCLGKIMLQNDIEEAEVFHIQ